MSFDFKNVQFDDLDVKVFINGRPSILENCKVSRFPNSSPMILFTLPGIPHWKQHICVNTYKNNFFVTVVKQSSITKEFSTKLSKLELKKFREYCNSLPEYDWK